MKPSGRAPCSSSKARCSPRKSGSEKSRIWGGGTKGLGDGGDPAKDGIATRDVSPSPCTTPYLGDEVQVVLPNLEANRAGLAGALPTQGHPWVHGGVSGCSHLQDGLRRGDAAVGSAPVLTVAVHPLLQDVLLARKVGALVGHPPAGGTRVLAQARPLCPLCPPGPPCPHSHAAQHVDGLRDGAVAGQLRVGERLAQLHAGALLEVHGLEEHQRRVGEVLRGQRNPQVLGLSWGRGRRLGALRTTSRVVLGAGGSSSLHPDLCVR